MHDLRRQALESGKTVSRKAKSKQSSTASSRGNSAANSRVGSKSASRAGSDDEGELSDETSFRYVEAMGIQPRLGNEAPNTRGPSIPPLTRTSVNSIDEMIATDDSGAATEAWKSELIERIEETIDRKRSSMLGREATLTAYIRILTSAYAEDEIRGKEMDLVASFLKSIKAETSEKETILAMKGAILKYHQLQCLRLTL